MTDKEITIKWDTTLFLEQLSMMDISDMDTTQLKRFLQTHIDVKWDRENNILKPYLHVSSQGVMDKVWGNIPKQWRV